MLRITSVGGTDLARADRRSLSDPYFVLRLNGDVVHVSDFKRNEESAPVWEADLSFPVPAEAPTLEISFVDKDRRGDDPLGTAMLPIEPGINKRVEAPLGGRGAGNNSVAWVQYALELPSGDDQVLDPAPEPVVQTTPEQPWWEIELPVHPPVVRKEIRSMDRSEQERYAAAVEKMMESPDGEPGNSQYFRVASYHGGPKTDHFNTQGEYCVHGYEAFPGWHRAYLLDFERTMRRADIALGGDGNIGLPYWGWDTVEINGEVFPQILREKFEKYAPDMFPPGMHHNNIDRFYEQYISMHPDSAREFRTKQRRWARRGGLKTQAGFPDGSWGRYLPFSHPVTKEPFRSEDIFDAALLGYAFDDLPSPLPDTSLNMMEMPSYAVFEGIIITQMKQSMNLHVFVVDRAAADSWTPPSDDDIDAFQDDPGYCGFESIFGLFPPGGCEACKYRPPFDVSVNITDGLRAANLRRKDAVLKVLVETSEDDAIVPLRDTPVPEPSLRGPMFDSDTPDISTEGENFAPDVEVLQTFLINHGYKSSDTADGVVGDITVAAIKAFQEANGLKIDGIAGPLTKQQITAPMFDRLPHISKPNDPVAPFSKGQVVRWSFLVDDIPGYFCSSDAVQADLQAAFDTWAPACDLTFKYVPHTGGSSAEGIEILIEWESESHSNSRASREHKFDGPGGALAKVEQVGALHHIAFDEDEKWLLSGQDVEPREQAGSFQLLSVAIHEIGHVLGLDHSSSTSDVMAPYYVADRTALSANDVARCQALYSSAPLGVDEQVGKQPDVPPAETTPLNTAPQTEIGVQGASGCCTVS